MGRPVGKYQMNMLISFTEYSPLILLGGEAVAQYLKVDVQTDCVSRSHHHKGLHVAVFEFWPYCEVKIKKCLDPTFIYTI